MALFFCPLPSSHISLFISLARCLFFFSHIEWPRSARQRAVRHGAQMDWFAVGTADYEYFTSWHGCVKEEEMLAYLCTYVSVEQQTWAIASYAIRGMPYAATGMQALANGASPPPHHHHPPLKVGSLAGQSSLRHANWFMDHAWVPWRQLCFRPDWVDTGKQAAVLSAGSPGPSSSFHLAPMLHVWEEHLILKGLFPFKHLDSAEMKPRFNSPRSSVETPACLHLTRRCRDRF